MSQTWKQIKEAIENTSIIDDTIIRYIDISNPCCEDDSVKIIEYKNLSVRHS